VSAAGDVLTVDEAADFLRIGRNTLYDLIGRGQIPHRRLGKQIRLSRAALVAWLGGCSLQVAKGEP
jgi:excisionase family DNA binding protein